ncbi:hypothetical protein BSAF29S_05015 [Bacillus safensis subsp. safensis]
MRRREASRWAGVWVSWRMRARARASSIVRGWCGRIGVSLLIVGVLAELQSQVRGQTPFGGAAGGADRGLTHAHDQGGPLGGEAEGELQDHHIKLALRQAGHCRIQAHRVFELGNLRAEFGTEAVQVWDRRRRVWRARTPGSPTRPASGPGLRVRWPRVP